MTNPTFAVANADFVCAQLAVGGDLDLYDEGLAADQVADLVANGISHVLDVREEWNDQLVWGRVDEVTYRWDGIDDRGQRVPIEWFDSIVTWALETLRDPNARLLTHCHMGINRGPSAGFAVLLGLGWDPIEALEAIRTARPIAYVAYAEDALRWHHSKTGASTEGRRHDRERVARWRRVNDLDVAVVIRNIRMAEGR